MKTEDLFIKNGFRQDTAVERKAQPRVHENTDSFGEGMENTSREDWQQVKREGEEKDLAAAERVLGQIQAIKTEPTDADRLVQEELLAQRKFIESAGATEVNRALAYVKFQDTLFLHIPPSKTIPLSQKLKLWRDGLGQTAQVVDQDKKVKVIEGVSWIVREHPELIKRLGFEVKYPGGAEKVFNWIANRFRSEKKELNQKMVMRREDFLKKYLKPLPM